MVLPLPAQLPQTAPCPHLTQFRCSHQFLLASVCRDSTTLLGALLMAFPIPTGQCQRPWPRAGNSHFPALGGSFVLGIPLHLLLFVLPRGLLNSVLSFSVAHGPSKSQMPIVSPQQCEDERNDEPALLLTPSMAKSHPKCLLDPYSPLTQALILSIPSYGGTCSSSHSGCSLCSPSWAPALHRLKYTHWELRGCRVPHKAHLHPCPSSPIFALSQPSPMAPPLITQSFEANAQHLTSLFF